MLAEWHIDSTFIIEHWTDEEFALKLDKLEERKQRERAAIKGEDFDVRKVSVEQFAKETGIEVKHGD